MQRYFYIIISAFIIATGCDSSSSTKGISGTINGAEEGASLYFQRFVNNRPVITDSVTLGPGGSFNILPSQALDLNFYMLKMDLKNQFLIITDSTECPSVTLDYGDFDKTAQIKGSIHTQKLLDYKKGSLALQEEIDEIANKAKDKTVDAALKAQFKSEYVEKTKLKRENALEFLNANLNSPASIAALSELNLKTDLDAFKKVQKSLQSTFSHSYYYKMVSQQIDNAAKKAAVQQNPGQQMPKNSKYKKGDKAPDITMNDPSGKSRSLSDLKGKVVMIDFWASWCGPCRRENPKVVEAYKEYNPDGFEVFSVSLDKDVKRWQQAIDQDQLLWENHVSDLQGWNNAASREYGISSIPHTILIDQEGTIVATHLRGNMLETELQKLFGH